MQILGLLVRRLEQINDVIGRAVSWLIVGVVITTFSVAILRYGFDLGWIWMQESYVWLNGILFMSAMGYTLVHNSHVRVDIFYRYASSKYRAWVDLCGTLIFFFPTLITIWLTCYPYVLLSWQRLETSQEAGGLPALFLLKTFLLVLIIVLFIQGIALLLRSILILRGKAEYEEPFDRSQLV